MGAWETTRHENRIKSLANNPQHIDTIYIKNDTTEQW